ncbi:trigger factor [candidate division WOR-3 bacterium]|uniref:Trigger factor n=1 Tax=candidate division WOR-3 bacterium TaxID=2052148 RepID=A0A938BPN6_UNCW3|nr:trigger factor [candidate division WOR-3 bacterium]
MEKTVRSPKEWLREIDVTLEPDKLKAKIEESLVELQPKAVVPGFRVGHVPRTVLERRIGNQLETAAAEELVENAIREVLTDDAIRPVTEPKFTNLEIAPDKTIKFQLSYEVIPEFQLREYAGLALKKEEPTGFEAEFERRLQERRERCATFKPVSHPAQEHDFVVVDRRTFIGEEEVAKPRTSVMMELGDRLNSAEVNAALIGARPGDERTAETKFPADHSDKELAGRTLTYKFTVRDVKERILPEVTEELARDLGYDSMDQLRIEINESILADRKRLEQNGLKNQAFDFLTAEHQFEPPESWVESSLERLRTQYNLPEDDATREKLMPVAQKWAKFDCIVARIADKEGVTVTDEELKQQAQDVAEESKRPIEEVESMLGSAVYKNQLLREKVLRLVVDKASVS